MQQKLRQEIFALINSKDTQSIIKSNDFYFQIAQNKLKDFLALEVSDDAKEYLIANKKNYEELKQFFEDVENLREFGNLIFEIVSYCDLRANRKNELNQYPNKRVLAEAFVRMNNWVEQLITYKFSNSFSDGSIKNAIQYLLDPEHNFTMLSENHRSQISENLFKKNYNKDNFLNDFFEFFSEYRISVRNSWNYTHVLTRIAYGIVSEWKESVIGIISPDGTKWQDEAIAETQGNQYIALWNHKRPNGTTKTLKLLRQRIEEKGYFNIYYTSDYTVNYIAEIVDFVTSQQELTKKKWEETFGNFIWDNKTFSGYQGSGKSAKWIYLARKIYISEAIPESSFVYLKDYGYPSVGCQAPVIKLKSEKEISNQLTMMSNFSLLKYKKQMIFQGPPGTGKTRVAKELSYKIIFDEEISEDSIVRKSQVEKLDESSQFKLVQFHPSYTYEDFVRGIGSFPNEDGEGVIYKAQNRLLAKFAEEAAENLRLSRGERIMHNVFEQKLVRLLDDIRPKIESGEGYLFDSKSTGRIIGIKEDGLIYNFPGRENVHYKVLFDDLEKVFNDHANLQKPIDLRDREKTIGLTMKGKYPYYYMLMESLNKIEVEEADNGVHELKNYVLVLDEINRANLSSVLGELIYALEYRDQAVESIYEVNGTNRFSLPSNLYIIGTMNTADRSVGHIDYAIRRRFAFVDVLPQSLEETDEIYFNKDAYDKVSALFTSVNVSSEFEIDHVQIGHSYFIAKKSEANDETKRDEIFAMKMKYEVVPILLEYVRDGILIGKVGNEEIKEYIKSLK